MNTKSILLVVVAVALLGAAGWRLVSHARNKPAAEPVPVRCETCGYEFVPKPGDENPVCPKCGGPAKLRLIYFRCRECGKTFVAYEMDPKQDLIRVPGGEWIGTRECDFLPHCPECGSGQTYFVKTPDQPSETPGAGN